MRIPHRRILASLGLLSCSAFLSTSSAAPLVLDRPKPLQVVAPGKDHQELKVIEETLEYISKLPGPIATVSVVGSVHSGKSYLINQLLGINPKGFPVGYTVQAETAGLWIWSEPLMTGDVSVLFLDTEGFFSANATESYDAKLFALSMLSSSELVYNTVKFIDNHDLELLEMLLKRANLFGLRSYASSAATWADGDKSGDAARTNRGSLSSFLRVLMPSSLSWVVQDFVQDLERKSPEEWLEQLILGGDGKTGSQKLKTMFTKVDCIPLPPPSGDIAVLQRLDQADDSNLDPTYLKDIDKFRSRLLSRAQRHPKQRTTSTGSVAPMSGRDLADLLRFLVASVNRGISTSSSDLDTSGDSKGLLSKTGSIVNGTHSVTATNFPELPSIWEQFTSLQLRLLKNDLLAVFTSDLNASFSTHLDKHGRPPAETQMADSVNRLELQVKDLWKNGVAGLERPELKQQISDTKHEFDASLAVARKSFEKEVCDRTRLWAQSISDEILKSFQKQLSKKQSIFPITPDDLDVFLQMESNSAILAFSRELASPIGGSSFEHSMCCKGLKEKLRQEITTSSSKLIKTNNDARDAHLQKATAAAVLHHQTAIANRKKTTGILKEHSNNIIPVLNGLRMECNNMFASEISLFSNLPCAAKAAERLKQSLDIEEGEFWREWTARCKDEAENFLRTSSVRFPLSLRRSVALPSDDGPLEAALSRAADEQRAKFKEVVFCLDSASGKEFQRSLESQISEALEAARKQNVRTLKEISGKPLESLRKELVEQASEYYFWPNFRAMAYDKASVTLQKAVSEHVLFGTPVDAGGYAAPGMSNSLLNSVITSFIDDDLKDALFLVNVGLWAGAMKLIGILYGFGCAILAVRRRSYVEGLKCLSIGFGVLLIHFVPKLSGATRSLVYNLCSVLLSVAGPFFSGAVAVGIMLAFIYFINPTAVKSVKSSVTRGNVPPGQTYSAMPSASNRPSLLTSNRSSVGSVRRRVPADARYDDNGMGL